MKKALFCMICAAFIIAALMLPAFANTDAYVFTDPFYDGMLVNDPDINSNTNLLRRTWTPSRGGHMNTIITKEADESLVLKFVAPQWLTRDNNNTEKTDSLMSIKRGDVNGFAGVILNYGSDYTGKTEGSVTQNDTLFNEIEAVTSDASAKYVLPSGFGYTFLLDSNTKVRFFVRVFGTADATGAFPFDVMYYDYDTGVDLGQAYHSYELFYNPDAQECRFYFDEKFVCELKYDHLDALACNSTLGAMKSQYFTEAVINDANGNQVASSDKALISNIGRCAMIATGTDTVIYLDYMENSSFVIYPGASASTTKAPESQAPETQAPTTQAPDTQAPDTQAPDTQAPTTQAPKEEKKGCKGMASAGVFAVAALIGTAFAVRRKH